MTPPPHVLRRLAEHTRTAASALEACLKAYDQSSTDAPTNPAHVSTLYARAASRINQAAHEIAP